jgi:major membrane immunogen (membrane-anchored lipoprotein)
MKKIKLIPFVLLMVLLFTGCNQDNKEPEDVTNQGVNEETTENQTSEETGNEKTDKSQDNSEIIDIAETFINLLNDGEYEKATENFDETMNKEMGPDKLKELWEAIEIEFGNFIDQDYDSTGEHEEYQLVFIKATFNDQDVTFRIVFNENNEIAGLFVV